MKNRPIVTGAMNGAWRAFLETVKNDVSEGASAINCWRPVANLPTC